MLYLNLTLNIFQIRTLCIYLQKQYVLQVQRDGDPLSLEHIHYCADVIFLLNFPYSQCMVFHQHTLVDKPYT